MPAAAEQIDAHIDIVTPENVSFHYEVAGPFRRLTAYLIDVAVRLAVAVVVGLAIAFAFSMARMPWFGTGLMLLLWFVLGYFYGGLFETFWNGQTPGKRIVRLRVVTIDGQPINAAQAVLRNLLREVDALPMPFVGIDVLGWLGVYWLGLLVMATNDRFQRVGDLVCGTMVVVERKAWLYGVSRIREPLAIQLAGLLPTDFEVSRGLGRALSAYVERRAMFTAARRAEIARHVAGPLVARFGLLPDTSHDLLLCALYHRTFIADGDREQPAAAASAPGVFTGG
jgi:uncharacterized RDD family membrane protein YckC